MDGSHGKLLFAVQGCVASSTSALLGVWALLPHPRSVKLCRDAASVVQKVVFNLISLYQGSQTLLLICPPREPQLDGEASTS